jgi:two-component system cell cycle response regulator
LREDRLLDRESWRSSCSTSTTSRCNDRIGHPAGDDVLAEAAGRLRTAVRSADIACRVGGDEFATLLPESGLPDAEELVRRILEVVAGRPIGEAGRLPLSAGITELRGGDGAAALFQRADGALDQAKEAGKGTVVAATRSSGSRTPGPTLADCRRGGRADV